LVQQRRLMVVGEGNKGGGGGGWESPIFTGNGENDNRCEADGRKVDGRRVG
jgi:hypothetical protein